VNLLQAITPAILMIRHSLKLKEVAPKEEIIDAKRMVKNTEYQSIDISTSKMKELFKITIDDSDDPKFVSIINRLITSSASKQSYKIVKIIKVKNWFDHKWLNYSGSEAVQFESGELVNNDMALSEKWKDQITFSSI